MAGAYPKGMPNYLCFTALEDGTFSLNIAQYVTLAQWAYVEYSLDEGSTWTKVNNVEGQAVSFTTPTVLAGNRILWRGSGTSTSNSSNVNNVRASIFSSTGRYNIGGILLSLLLGDKATISSSLPANNTFAGLFRDNTKLESVEELVLAYPTKIYCYESLFLGCTNLAYPPKQFPKSDVVNWCYGYMFKNCNLQTAVELPAPRMISGCYRELFYGNSNINYIKMLAYDNMTANNCMTDWVNGVASTGIFVKHIDAQWTTTGNSGVPTNWTVIYYDPALDKYYLDQQRSQECDDHGNPI